VEENVLDKINRVIASANKVFDEVRNQGLTEEDINEVSELLYGPNRHDAYASCQILLMIIAHIKRRK